MVATAKQFLSTHQKKNDYKPEVSKASEGTEVSVKGENTVYNSPLKCCCFVVVIVVVVFSMLNVYDWCSTVFV